MRADWRRAIAATLRHLAALRGTWFVSVCAAALPIGAEQARAKSRLDDHVVAGREGRSGQSVLIRPAGVTRVAGGGTRAPQPRDDWTFRPTVLVRRGKYQGSGTVIASVEGASLVLTAAHVVRDRGPVVVEFHRYNLGLEKARSAPGPWPRVVPATLLATDRAADLAIVRITKLHALPYVARMAREHIDVPPDSTVSSIGIDLGKNLSEWSTRLVQTVRFELNGHREQRPFLITERIPEHGRSGGGLYLPDGELVGVCIGHAQLVRGKEMGVFASRECIRILLADRKLSAAIGH
jgi:S1-C subfamily serine protease